MLQNFPLFSEKSTASINLHLSLATSQQTLSLVDHATNIFAKSILEVTQDSSPAKNV